MRFIWSFPQYLKQQAMPTKSVGRRSLYMVSNNHQELGLKDSQERLRSMDTLKDSQITFYSPSTHMMGKLLFSLCM